MKAGEQEEKKGAERRKENTSNSTQKSSERKGYSGVVGKEGGVGTWKPFLNQRQSLKLFI